MPLGLNLVGPQVRKFRSKKGWTQEELARRMQLAGWSISRHSLAKLELQLRRVSDCELLFLTKVLKIKTSDLLFPKGMPLKSLGPAFQGKGNRIALFPARGDR